MRVVGWGCRQPEALPILQASVSKRIVQIGRDTFRSISECFAFLPLFAQSFSVEALQASTIVNKKNIARSVFTQFANVEKKKWIAVAAVGTISCLMYALAKRYTRLPFSQEPPPSCSSVDGLNNVVHKAVFLVGITVSLLAIVSAMPAIHWRMTLNTELKDLDNKIAQEKILIKKIAQEKILIESWDKMLIVKQQRMGPGKSRGIELERTLLKWKESQRACIIQLLKDMPWFVFPGSEFHGRMLIRDVVV